jgi:hypothetical protein
VQHSRQLFPAAADGLFLLMPAHACLLLLLLLLL